jgi:hypothetical protein
MAFLLWCSSAEPEQCGCRSGVAPALVILSDDAGQFNIAGFLHALCWVHAERTIHTLLPFSDANRAAQAAVRDQIWRFYQDLKAFKRTPSEETKRTLGERFDVMFTRTDHVFPDPQSGPPASP